MYFQQLGALLEKGWIVRRVHYISTIFELIGPILIVYLSAYVIHSAQSAMNRVGSTTPSPTQPPITTPSPPENHFYTFINFSRGEYTSPKIFYAPKNDATDAVMKYFSTYTNVIELQPLTTEQEYEIKVKKYQHDRDYNAYGILFDKDFKSLNDKLSYKLTHLEVGDKWIIPMENMFPSSSNVPYGSLDFHEQFAHMLAFINQAYIQLRCLANSSKCDKNIPQSITLFAMPFPKKDDKGAFSIFDLVSSVMLTSYILVIPIIVKRITDEKASKAKELLSMMGMSNFGYYSSHFINFFIILMFHGLVFTYILFYSSYSAFKYTSPLVFILGFALFSAQVILFSILVTTVFNRYVTISFIVGLYASCVCVLQTCSGSHNDIHSVASNDRRDQSATVFQ